MLLLESVKEYLKIDWDDEDKRLLAIIARGKANLEGLTGTTLDFETEGQPKALLLDYCRYNYNNASEYFEENYGKEILRLIFQEAIKERG